MMMFDAGAAEGGSAPQNGRGGSRRILGPVDFDATLASLEAKIEAAIRESPSEDASWAIVGIKRKGAVIARRLWESLRARYPSLAYGELDIALYRDDYHLEQGHRVVSGTELDFSVEGASIVLVDDVLFTGPTVRAAMHQLLDFGRPKRIWLSVLVDRGNRELPIEANHVALTVPTRESDRIVVSLRELGEPEDAVDLLIGPESAEG